MCAIVSVQDSRPHSTQPLEGWQYLTCTQPRNTLAVNYSTALALHRAKEFICGVARRRHSNCIAHCQRAATPCDLPRTMLAAQYPCNPLLKHADLH